MCHTTTAAGRREPGELAQHQGPRRAGDTTPRQSPCKHKHPAPQPGKAGSGHNQNQRTHATNPSQNWRGTGGARTQKPTPQHSSLDRRVESNPRTHTHTPQIPATIGAVKSKPMTEHTHRRPQRGMVGYGQRAHRNTHTLQHHSQGWRGESKTRTQTHTPQTQATIGERKPKSALEQRHHRPKPGLAGYRQSAHTNTHPRKLKPGFAGGKQNPYPNTHTTNPSQDARGEAKTWTRPNTMRPQQGLAGYRQSAHTNTHTPMPQPGLAG